MQGVFLVNHDNEILKTELENFDFNNPPTDPIEFAKLLTQKMLEFDGIGLSANQLGYPYRCFAIKSNPIIVMYNPKIVDVSEKNVYLEEGCLTYPGLSVKIKRPEMIRIRFTLPNGEIVTEKYSGLTARIIQHEMEHMDGKIFYDSADFYHKTQALKKYKKWRNKASDGLYQRPPKY